MNLTDRQKLVRDKSKEMASFFGIDPAWAVGEAMTESSLGMNMKSPTGCVGPFQMSSIAMKDLLQEMATDPFIGIACGVAFMYLLLKRHKTIEEATSHFCDPKDRDFYISRVKGYMDAYNKGEI